MDLSYVALYILQAAPATASVPAEEASIAGLMLRIFSMMALLYLIFYFMVIKPQSAKSQSQQKMLQELKRGDLVGTTSGIVGKVFEIDQEYVLIEASPGTKIKFERDKIIKKIERKEKGEAKVATV